MSLNYGLGFVSTYLCSGQSRQEIVVALAALAKIGNGRVCDRIGSEPVCVEKNGKERPLDAPAAGKVKRAFVRGAGSAAYETMAELDDHGIVWFVKKPTSLVLADGRTLRATPFLALGDELERALRRPDLDPDRREVYAHLRLLQKRAERLDIPLVIGDG